jgi:hypothetical protein
MTTSAIEKVPYTHEELCRRFAAWADLPTHSDKSIVARQIAWHQYCDARDGLPEGTSARRYILGSSARLDDRQLAMFQ